eukprot:TRINITY_DN10410_c0_g1_i3.p3 TRINITY_DN10410_c0_g1~~TRINITY_DN10410_c0_g1_i3.p3  ORF type:complete len:122 (-),score=12.37 TRINITY_DN10410_c0_g1_i3:182-547(-)
MVMQRRVKSTAAKPPMMLNAVTHLSPPHSEQHESNDMKDIMEHMMKVGVKMQRPTARRGSTMKAKISCITRSLGGDGGGSEAFVIGSFDSVGGETLNDRKVKGRNVLLTNRAVRSKNSVDV